MKPNIEIDVTDPKKLQRAIHELRRLLEIAEFALGKYVKPQDNGHGTPRLPMPGLDMVLDHPVIESTQSIEHIIRSMPPKFTTTDVILALGDEGKENRGRVKMALKRAVGQSLRLVRAGIGRRPSEYEKVGPTA